MKVLIVNRDQGNSGGQEIVAQNIATGLAERAHQVSFLTTKGEEVFTNLHKSIEKIELDADSWFDDKRIKAPHKLREYLQNSEFDAVLVNNPLNLIGQFVLKHIPKESSVWCSFHGKMNSRNLLKSIINHIRKYIYTSYAARNSTGFIYLNTEDAEYFSGYVIGKKPKEIVIPNGIDPSLFVHKNKQPGHTKFLFIGVLNQNKKGVIDLITAIENMTSSDVEAASFEFAGRDPLGLRDRINQLKVAKYLGVLSRAEIARKMAESDVLILPSYSECMPMVILEAMSSGMLILSTDIYGISQIFHGESENILIKPGDIERLGEEICALIGDKGRINSTGKQNRRLIEKYYTHEAMVKNYERVFQN